MRDTNPRTAAIVLAGGKGRRIGGAKAERLLGGVRLIDRALALARSFSAHVAVSVAAVDDLPDLDASVIVDVDPNWGALAGLAAGMDFARSRALDQVITLPCDTPFLPGDLLDRLEAGLSPPVAAAIPESGGRLHLACGLWRVGARSLLNAYADAGGRSLYGLAQRAGFSSVEWSDSPVDPFFNINTPDELVRAQAMVDRFPSK